MKKSIFRWGFVLAMLVGLMTIGASAVSIAPDKTVCPDSHEGWKELGAYLETLTPANGCYTTAGGNYYLEKNLELDYYIKLNGKTTLCLNGFSIKFTNNENTTNYRGIRAVSRVLTICDCSEDHSGVMSAELPEGQTNNAYLINGATDAAKIILEGGTFDCTNTKFGIHSSKGAIIINDDNVTVTGGDSSDVYMACGGTSDTLEVQAGTIGKFAIADSTVVNSNIYGGTFTGMTSSTVKSYLATDMPVSIETAGDGCVVSTGFYRSGGNHDFKESLNFRLFLKCDNGYITDNEDFSALTLETSMGTNSLTKSISMLVFRVYKLTAKDIGTPVTFTVKDADGTVLFEETLSVADMAKEQYEASEDEAFKTLMEDLVNYGNAAAEAFGGTTVDALGEGTTALTQDWTRGENDYGVTNGDHDMYATLSLKNTIELNVYHEDAEGNVTYRTLSDIAIANALTSRDVTFDDDCTVTYSIKDYILDVLNDGVDNGQDALISALQKYIDSLCKVVKG